MTRWTIAVGLAAGAMLVGGCDSKTEGTPTAASTTASAKGASSSGPAAAAQGSSTNTGSGSAAAASAQEAPAASDTASASATATATASATPPPADSSKPNQPAGAYAALEIMKHLPPVSACTQGRMFVDLGKLMRTDAFRPLANNADTKLPDLVGGHDGKELAKVLAELKAEGLRPTDDIREIAICMQGRGDNGTFAIGGAFGGKDVLAGIAKVATAHHHMTFTRQEEKGFVYYTEKHMVLAQVAPNVIAGARTKEDLRALRSTPDRSADWAVAGKLLAFSANQGNTVADMDLVQKGDGFDFRSVTKAAGAQAEKAKKELAMAKIIFAGMAEEMGKKLKGTAFAPLADDLKTVKIDGAADGTKVTLTAHIVSAHLSTAIKAISEMSAGDIEKQLGQITQ